MSTGNKMRVIVLTNAFSIKGDIDLPSKMRLTDYMIQTKGFIALTDVEVRKIGGGRVLLAPFVNVNRDNIEVVSPDTE